jgi:hypothetical protein
MARPSAIVPVNQERRWIRWMNYGEPGCGKSALAGTAPKCLILASDAEEPTSAAMMGSTADMWVVFDYNDLTEAVEYVRHDAIGDGYEFVWLDNGTLFQEQGMDHIMADLVADNPHRNPWVPDKPQYLLNQNKLGDLIRKLKAVPIHIGITAHVMRIESADGDQVALPLFQGGRGEYSQKICGYMNMVTYMRGRQLKGGKFQTILYTSKRSVFYAKDRYNAFGGRIVDPTIPEMMEVIKKKLPSLGKREPVKTSRTTAKKAPAKKAAVAKKAPAKKAAPTKKAAAAKKVRK